MTGWIMVDVAIGLVLLFMLLSLFCSIFQEWIASLLDLRGKNLTAAIARMLGSDGTGMQTAQAKKVLDHPLVVLLTKGGPTQPTPGAPADPAASAAQAAPADPAATVSTTKAPSYLPSNHFALALISTLDPVREEDGTLTLKGLRDSVAAINGNDSLKSALSSILDGAENNVDKAIKGIEGWFDATMDRASGWYRRQATRIMFAIGLVLAITVNADAIQVAVRMSQSEALRASVTAYAALVASPDAKPDPALEKLKKEMAAKFQESGDLVAGFGGLPVGWDLCIAPPPKPSSAGERTVAPERTFDITACYKTEKGDFLKHCALAWAAKILGILLTAAMAAIGAPFWFELLVKLNAIRAAGPKPAKATP